MTLKRDIKLKFNENQDKRVITLSERSTSLILQKKEKEKRKK